RAYVPYDFFVLTLGEKHLGGSRFVPFYKSLFFAKTALIFVYVNVSGNASFIGFNFFSSKFSYTCNTSFSSSSLKKISQAIGSPWSNALNKWFSIRKSLVKCLK